MWVCACSDSAPKSAPVSREGERQERRIRQGIQQGQATVSPTRTREDPHLKGADDNDTLRGHGGNDIYFSVRSEGQDFARDNSGMTDKLLYHSGIDPFDLLISRQANDLRLAIHGLTDSVTIQN